MTSMSAEQFILLVEAAEWLSDHECWDGESAKDLDEAIDVAREIIAEADAAEVLQ